MKNNLINLAFLSFFLIGCNPKITSSTTSSSTFSSSTTPIKSEVAVIIENTLKKEHEYVEKEKIEKIKLKDFGYSLNGLSINYYSKGLLIIEKDHKLGLYSLILNKVILEPCYYVTSTTLISKDYGEFGYIIMFTNQKEGDYKVLDLFGNLIKEGNDYTSIDLNNFDVVRNNNEYYLIDSHNNDNKCFKYNSDYSLVESNLVEGEKKVDFSMFEEDFRLIDLKDYGYENYYLTINYNGRIVDYEFYHYNDKINHYSFNDYWSINLVSDTIIVQKDEESEVEAINYLTNEKKVLSVDYKINSYEGKAYKDENEIYNYVGIYTSDNRNCLIDKNGNIHYEVDNIHLTHLEYFNGNYYDKYNNTLIDPYLRKVKKINYSETAILGEIMEFKDTIGNGALDKEGNIVIPPKAQTFVSNAINDYVYTWNESGDFYRVNYQTLEEEKVGQNIRNIYGNLYYIEDGKTNHLANEKEIIYTTNSMADYAVIDINIYPQKKVYFGLYSIFNKDGEFILINI